MNDCYCNLLCLNFSVSQSCSVAVIFTKFSLCVLKRFILKKLYQSIGSYSGTQLFNEQPPLLRVEAQKWPKVTQQLSNVQAQIVPRFKQLRLKLTAQQAILLVD